MGSLSCVSPHWWTHAVKDALSPHGVPPASWTHATRSHTQAPFSQEAEPVRRYPSMHDGFGGHTPGLAKQLLVQPTAVIAKAANDSDQKRAITFMSGLRQQALDHALAKGLSSAPSVSIATLKSRLGARLTILPFSGGRER